MADSYWRYTGEKEATLSPPQSAEQHVTTITCRCFLCGGFGHKSEQCPTGERRCFVCGDFGHLSKDCTHPDNGGEKRQLHYMQLKQQLKKEKQEKQQQGKLRRQEEKLQKQLRKLQKVKRQLKENQKQQQQQHQQKQQPQQQQQTPPPPSPQQQQQQPQQQQRQQLQQQQQQLQQQHQLQQQRPMVHAPQHQAYDQVYTIVPRDDWVTPGVVKDSVPPAGRSLNLAGVSSGYAGYLSSDGSVLGSRHLWKANDLGGASSDYLHSDILSLRTGAYGRDDIMGIGSRATPVLSGLTAGASLGGGFSSSTPVFGGLTAGTSLGGGFSSSLEDPSMIRQRRDAALGVNPGISDLVADRSNSSLRKAESLSADESNVLFVEGLPNDCTRREVAHLFRPFIGFKEIRVVHKEPRRTGDKALVLCFVEFNDAKCALTALEALQGYKFDDKKTDAPALRIQFAHFPFRPPSGRDDLRADAR